MKRSAEKDSPRPERQSPVSARKQPLDPRRPNTVRGQVGAPTPEPASASAEPLPDYDLETMPRGV